MKCSIPCIKTAFAVMIVSVVLSSYTSVVASEPFASKVKLPDKIENRELWVELIKKWNIPAKDDVAVPAYPGAVIVGLTESGPMEVNYDTLMMLPSLTMASEDTPEQVVSFYKEKLKDWKHKNSFDMFDIFWIGPDEFNNLDMEQGMTIPNVVVFEATSAQTDFMPKAKTTITIVYDPKK